MASIVPTGTTTYKTSEVLRIKKRHQIAFRRWINRESGESNIWKYVGADVAYVREWINERMVEGMTWNNYGTVWHIDHIVPLRMFDVTNEDELKICWHYKNLMPLLRRDGQNKEGNVFFAFILLDKIKGEDYFYNKLYQRILPEIDTMNKYIFTYCKEITQS